jgi:hypothetical protein
MVGVWTCEVWTTNTSIIQNTDEFLQAENFRKVEVTIHENRKKKMATV